MGLHVILRGGQDWLAATETLDPARAAASEAAADLWIAMEFVAWDRSAWSPDSQPREVSQAALAVASAEYIDRTAIASDPQGKADKHSARLKKSAEALAARARSNGYLLSPRGQKEFPKDQTRTMEINLL